MPYIMRHEQKVVTSCILGRGSNTLCMYLIFNVIEIKVYKRKTKQSLKMLRACLFASDFFNTHHNECLDTYKKYYIYIYIYYILLFTPLVIFSLYLIQTIFAISCYLLPSF